MSIPRRSVRFRLTLWYVGSLTLILVLFAFGVYELVAWSFRRQAEQQVAHALEEVADGYREGGDELTEIEHHGVVTYFHLAAGEALIHQSDEWRRHQLSTAPTGLAGDEMRYFTAPSGEPFLIRKALITDVVPPLTVTVAINQRMTHDTFRTPADFQHPHDIAWRVFVLLGPPFVPTGDAVERACRSIDVAAECGATACSVIPTRGGNGAMEALGDAFVPPRLAALETVMEYGLSRRGLRVFADLWDVERFFSCDCSPARASRLATMNREQRVPERVACVCT